MKKLTITGLLCLLMAGCQTVTSNTPSSGAATVNAGDPADTVIARMGQPGNRTFRGSAEAWQYCRTSFLSPIEMHTTVWLVSGRVVALSTRSIPYANGWGVCNGAYPQIDWGQVPPDVRIAIDVR